ncbi:MAG: DUF934 domain-containing protein [Acetobacter sp.]|jgi:uncharacterized protein (DUF934 family)
MPLLEKGHVIADRWQIVTDDAAIPENGPVLVPAPRLSEALGRTSKDEVGVILTPDMEVATLRPAIDRLSLIALTFPVFRDGRGFSQARALREHLHFKGDIRATGHILPDQYDMLLRCGVTTVSVADDADITFWQKAMDRYTVASQPSILDEKSEGHGLRRFMK